MAGVKIKSLMRLVSSDFLVMALWILVMTDVECSTTLVDYSGRGICRNVRNLEGGVFFKRYSRD